MKIKWWHLVLGGAGLGLIGLAGYEGSKLAKILIQRKYGALTEELLAKIYLYADKHGVPRAIALAVVDIESGFDPHAYNPECTGGTREYGKRVAYSPYVICSNGKYRRLAIVEKKDRFVRAVDSNKPQLWGSFGLTQMLPDTAWGWGWSPEQPNAGLFDVDVNLDLGLKKLGGAWKRWANMADLRSSYVSGDSFREWSARNAEEASRVVAKFDERVTMYERKFNLPRSRRS